MKLSNLFGGNKMITKYNFTPDTFTREQIAPNLSLLPKEHYCTKESCRHDTKEDATPNDFCLKCKCFIPLDIPKIINKFKIAEKMEKI